MGQVFTSATGNSVAISVKMEAGDRLDWWIRIVAKYDYGYGKGQGVGDYPWIVEIISGTTQTANFVRTYKPGLYAAELNIMGKGFEDFSEFALTAPSTVSTLITGNNVAFTVNMGTGARLDWWLRVISKYDYGYGKGQGVGDYPWIVEVINGTTQTASFIRTYKPGMYAVELNIMGVGPVDYKKFELAGGAPTVQVPKATIFNWCWTIGTTTGGCSVPRVAPAVPVGSVFTINADIFNASYDGKVRTVFKVDGVQVSSQDKTMTSMTMWNVAATSTMPNKNTGIAIETYAWDGSTWVLNETKNDIISLTAPACSTVSLDPFTALVDPADTTTYKVTMTATVAPFGTGGASFPVIFKSGSGTVLGTCDSIVGTGKCTFIWDYNILKDTSPDTTYSDGTAGHYVTAVVGTAGTIGACTSNQSTIVVGKKIKQWTVNIIVKDANTGTFVSGANAVVGTVGGPTKSKYTDGAGTASFIVDEGTIGTTITKSGYNNYATAEYVFMNKTFTYSFVPTPIVPTTGSVQFVSVPSGAAIYLDGGVTSSGLTPKTIDGISAGTHSFTLKLAGYNDQSGTVIVQSGSLAYAYASMTVLTPTKGALNITSHPVMGAEVFIDGVDYKVTTSGATLITDISPGTHQYTLKMTGYKDSIGTFGVSAGSTVFIDAEMVPLLTIGSIEITSTPSGAEVFIDNVNTSKTTPASVMNLATGSHSYKLVLMGYQDSMGVFDITAGKVTPVDVILKAIIPTTGTLVIKSDPPNAKVFIDGDDVGKVTPAIIKDLTAESHTYLLKLAEYKDAGAVISITAGFTKTVNVNLEQIVTPPSGAGEGMGIGGALAVGAAAVVILGYLSKDK